MATHLKRLDDWVDPENKYLFFSINNFALYLGIPQKAIMNLVASKFLESVVVEGRTFIPIRTKHLLLWSGQSKVDCESRLDDYWGFTKKEEQE
jgi:hypothetical protein